MIQEPNKAKSHLSNTYVVVASCFHSILHLKTQVEGACELNLLLQFLYQYSVNASKHMQKYLKDVSQLFLYAKFQHVLPRKMLGQYFFFCWYYKLEIQSLILLTVQYSYITHSTSTATYTTYNTAVRPSHYQILLLSLPLLLLLLLQY